MIKPKASPKALAAVLSNSGSGISPGETINNIDRQLNDIFHGTDFTMLDAVNKNVWHQLPEQAKPLAKARMDAVNDLNQQIAPVDAQLKKALKGTGTEMIHLGMNPDAVKTMSPEVQQLWNKRMWLIGK